MMQDPGAARDDEQPGETGERKSDSLRMLSGSRLVSKALATHRLQHDVVQPQINPLQRFQQEQIEGEVVSLRAQVAQLSTQVATLLAIQQKQPHIDNDT